jgi:hypothetical protein
VEPDLEQKLVNCKKEIQRLARENKDLRDEIENNILVGCFRLWLLLHKTLQIENNMQPKTLTLVFDDAVNDLACIRVGDLIEEN